jgi:hypothetical protein
MVSRRPGGQSPSPGRLRGLVSGGPVPRALMFLTCGVVAAVVTGLIDAALGNLVIALVIGAITAFAMGRAIDPAATSLRKRRGGAERSSRPASSGPVPENTRSRETAYDRDHVPMLPVQQNHKYETGEST